MFPWLPAGSSLPGPEPRLQPLWWPGSAPTPRIPLSPPAGSPGQVLTFTWSSSATWCLSAPRACAARDEPGPQEPVPGFPEQRPHAQDRAGGSAWRAGLGRAWGQEIRGKVRPKGAGSRDRAQEGWKTRVGNKPPGEGPGEDCPYPSNPHPGQ